MPLKAKREGLRVALVEDDRDTRESFAFLINEAEGMTCVAAVASGEEALVRFPGLQPDVVLLDIQLAGELSGTDCIKNLKDHLPTAKIVMLTGSQDPPTIGQCLMRGADGYLHKSMPPERIPQLVRDAAEGCSPMSPEIARLVLRVLQSFDAPNQEWEKLSPRERDVLELLTRGCIKKEVADRLGISEETVKTHCRHIFDKLHVNCCGHAVAKAIPLTVLQVLNPSLPSQEHSVSRGMSNRRQPTPRL